jgi:hypothetical protein
MIFRQSFKPLVFDAILARRTMKPNFAFNNLSKYAISNHTLLSASPNGWMNADKITL